MDLNKSFKPPQGARNNARRGLELRAKHGRGGLSTQQAGKEGIRSGVARARDLANGKSMSLATVRRMRAFFERHEKNKNSVTDSGEPGAGKIAWLLWGGDAGRRWANGVLRQEGVLDKNHLTPSPTPDNLSDQNMSSIEKRTNIDVAKVDGSLGLVFGWAMVSKVDGQPYFDLQGDHIPDETIIESSADFMANSRAAKAMHAGEDRGSILFAFPMTEDVAKGYGIDTQGKYGLLVAAKFDEETVQKFADGTYTGFSIGGLYGDFEEVED